MIPLTQLVSQYEDAFAQLEQLLIDRLSPARCGALSALATSILSSRGKRLRPLLLFITHGQGVSPAMIQTATAIELIHMASLIHDDILDHATIRHHLPTIVAEYGLELAIPSGVWLYAKALECLVDAGELAVINEISHTVDWLCRGEMTQVIYRNHVGVSPLAYFRIIHQKTASLFGAAAWAGAYTRPDCRYSMKQFGKSLGVLYQLTDDILDFVGDEAQLQKTGSQDMALGDITYPIIVALSQSSPENRRQLERLLSQHDPSNRVEFMRLMQQTQAVESTLRCIRYYRNRCYRWCRVMPESTQQALASLIEMVCHRVMPFLESLNHG